MPTDGGRPTRMRSFRWHYTEMDIELCMDMYGNVTATRECPREIGKAIFGKTVTQIQLIGVSSILLCTGSRNNKTLKELHYDFFRLIC